MDYKPRSILATNSIWHRIKRSWHSIEGAYVIVGVERVSFTCRYPARTVKVKMKYMDNGKRKWVIKIEHCSKKIDS